MGRLGSVRLVHAGWAAPGRVKLLGDRRHRVRLRPEHPRARDLRRALRPLLLEGQTLGFLV